MKKAALGIGLLCCSMLVAPVMAAPHGFDRGPSGHHGGGAPRLGEVFFGLALGGMVYHLINDHVYYQDGPTWYLHDQRRNAYVVVQQPQSTTQVVVNQSPSYSNYSGDVPAGAVYPSLPNGAVAVNINGIQYFEKTGTLFLPSEQNGHTVYVVVRNP
ncbi:DUF6515 family protein [Pokkaliibacter sp. CJK22405]|uniref:DUF6515 family protein n=1 Tax=Pokkaliibacter sp. CJK22405 TaxID=3384615 RepID=UPI003984B893